eukprot:Gb_34192 [translate_table: standard]
MAMAQSLRNQKKKIVLTMLKLQLDGRKGNIGTKTHALKSEGNANNSFRQDVRKLCKQGRLKEALRILQVLNLRLDSSTYHCFLQECIDEKDLSQGKLVHAHMNDKGFIPDRFLQNKLVNMYAKCGSLVDARGVFNQMAARDVFSWTVIIAAYAKNGLSVEALTLFNQMRQEDVQPNQFTFASILPACANLAALQQGMKIHEEIIKSGFQCDIFVSNALVDMYAKCERIENARNVFDKMPKRDVVSWTVMIAGYSQNGLLDEAVKLFHIMPQRDGFSCAVMIAGYAQNGCVDDALKLFQKMPQRDAVSWNAMISGYAQNGLEEEALKLFRQMQLEGVKSDTKTFASLLVACANLVALEQGVEIHEQILRSGFQSNVFLANALVDMYAKCGNTKKARNLFDKMDQQNTFSWTAMIAGYAQNEHVDEAIKLFQKMPHRDVFSWTAMIAGYAQNGHVDEALKLFQQMPEQDVVSWNNEDFRIRREWE